MIYECFCCMGSQMTLKVKDLYAVICLRNDEAVGHGSPTVNNCHANLLKCGHYTPNQMMNAFSAVIIDLGVAKKMG